MFVPRRLFEQPDTITLEWHLNVAGNNKAYLGIPIKCRLSVKFVFNGQIFVEVPCIKFHTEIRPMAAAMMYTDRHWMWQS